MIPAAFPSPTIPDRVVFPGRTRSHLVRSALQAGDQLGVHTWCGQRGLARPAPHYAQRCRVCESAAKAQGYRP